MYFFIDFNLDWYILSYFLKCYSNNCGRECEINNFKVENCDPDFYKLEILVWILKYGLISRPTDIDVEVSRDVKALDITFQDTSKLRNK